MVVRVLSNRANTFAQCALVGAGQEGRSRMPNRPSRDDSASVRRHEKQARDVGSPVAEGTRLYVFDEDEERNCFFDIEECQRWGPVQIDVRSDSWKLFIEPPVFGRPIAQTLYRHSPKNWTLILAWQHLFSSMGRQRPRAKRLSDQQAVDWMWKHGIDPPEDVVHLLEKWRFLPGAPFGSDDTPDPDTGHRPHWDEQRCELRLGDEVVRKVKRTAVNVINVLNCFEEDNWENRIDSPFTDDESGKTTLRETVRTLNERQNVRKRIRFEADGSGRGLLWKLSS